MSSSSNGFEPVKLGEVRPSQLVHTYGVGSVLELPNFSVIIPGIDGAIHSEDPWHIRKMDTTIKEERLLEHVQDVLGPTVAALRAPVRIQPPPGVRRVGEWDATGTWTLPFPRWLRCPACNTLSRYDSGKFQLDHTNTYRPHEARYVHYDCTKLSRPTAMPVRFVLACPRGHLDDFPWGAWAHRNNGFRCPVSENPQSNLALVDVGLAQRPTSQKVLCRHSGCDHEAAVQPAFGPDGWKNLPKCGGGRPHLGDRESCDENVVALLVGATNMWFADRRTVLSIPHDEVPLVTQVVRDNRPRFEKSLAEGGREHFKKYAEMMEEFSEAEWLRSDRYSVDDLWDEFEKQEASLVEQTEERDILGPEWTALTQPIQGEHPDFEVEGTKTPPETEVTGFSTTRLVTRLREVSALVGFTRLDSPSDSDAARRAPLARGPVRWVPAAVALGEGILVRLNEDAVQSWENEHVPKFDRVNQLHDAHQAWRKRRGIESSPPPSARFALVHTLAHLLIHEISHEAGYAAASIRERIYARTPTNGSPMAGVLLYTSAPDSEGTLGGLVSLGMPERLGEIIDGAFDRARVCTSDPFCATHVANGIPSGGVEGDGSLHGAACHVCLFLPETSCDHANRYLDRTLLVPTLVDGDEHAFTA